MIALIRRHVLGWLRPLPALIVVAVTLCLPFTTSCGDTQPPKDPASEGAKVRESARMAFSVAALALQTLDDVRAAWMRSVAAPSPWELEVAANVNTGLHAAHDALERARPWIETGTGDEAAAKKEVREAVIGLLTIAKALDGAAHTVPDQVKSGLEFVAGVLGVGVAS